MKVVALSGGVGGARMADGLSNVIPPDNLSIIVNVADDFEWFGLTICPDIDTVIYTLAGREDPDAGWGLREDTFHCLDSMKRLNADAWFRVGDQDLATHLVRSKWLWEGATLTEATRKLCRMREISQRVLPATDDLFRTIVETDSGDMEFQEFFVHQACQPEVHGFHFQGSSTAVASEIVLSTLQEAELVIVCPSNPFVSIQPILVLPGVREMIHAKQTIAISPIISGKAVKGPAAKMFRDMGREPSAKEIAMEYRGFASGFVLDSVDHAQAQDVRDLGMKVLLTDTLMVNRPARKRLASAVLDFARSEGWV